jgi:hypothetical protein
MHRKIALKEMLNEFDDDNKLKNIFFIKYSIGDTLAIDKDILRYIKKNPDLPGYILYSLEKKHTIELMTFEEFLLVNPDLVDNYATVIYKSFPDIIEIGYKVSYNFQKNLISSGSYWEFKYGFLWSWGEI